MYSVCENGEQIACKLAISGSSLEREANMLLTINREAPGICPRHLMYTKYRNRDLIKMQLISGTLLDELLAGEMSAEEAESIFTEIVKCVHKLHSLPQPIVFMDLKPDNICVCDKKVILLDAGCAQHAGDELIPCGSPGYSDPTQFINGERVNSAYDIYALGRILEKMVKAGLFSCVKSLYFKRLVKKMTSQNLSMRPSAMEVLFLLRNKGGAKLRGIRIVQDVLA